MCVYKLPSIKYAYTKSLRGVVYYYNKLNELVGVKPFGTSTIVEPSKYTRPFEIPAI